MVYKIIKEILNLEDVSDNDKISMIAKMTEKFEAIDGYAEEMALKEGREVTFEDEYNATFKVASEMGISFEKNENEITEVIIEGLNYIIEQQSDNGGWGRTQKARIPKRLHSYIKDDNLTPLPSAWVTSLAMSTLADGSRFIEKTSKIDKAIKPVIKGQSICMRFNACLALFWVLSFNP